MTSIGVPTALAGASFARRTDIYTRHTYIRTRPAYRRLFAQVLVLGAAGCTMTVQASPEALGVDFRSQSIRPDVPGNPLPRPGFQIADELKQARLDGRSSLLFNGNNIGYWGNQFVIESGRFGAKEKGPIFDDKKLADHAHGRFMFFSWSESRFRITEIDLRAVARDPESSGIGFVQPLSSDAPKVGLSGFPLVRRGESVWRNELAQAWDPRLLYNVGKLVGVDRADVLKEINARAAARAPLARHAMTLVGVNDGGDAIVVVVEKSEQRSDGVSVAGAARLMLELGARHAIALGAAGDAQLASTDEGFLVSPLIEPHSRGCARDVERRLRGRDVDGMEVAARPVPCLVTIEGNGPLSAPEPGPDSHEAGSLGTPAHRLLSTR
ncbi:MAG: phosphodiester glycosidase family protein [Actinomycetota bacterium]|nr:phosphodiester glycosidase family protein [Actinomycetota bacterium]